LGLNNVVRKWTDDIASTSHQLISVPGGTEGPGGVLVCSADTIAWKNMNRPTREVKLPRRQHFGEKQGTMIVSYATHKQKELFFILAQTELGDLFKITLDYKQDVVEAINVKYFDTVPVATSLCVFKTGFLFAAAEAGNHPLYQFQAIGDDAEDRTYRMPNDADTYFKPRAFKNLVLIDELPNLAPITDAKVLNLLREETPQLYTLSGRGKSASMRVLRSGIAPNEIGTTPATLPGTPTAIITVKRNSAGMLQQFAVRTAH
jgi:splicing factor 3B subunit 3